MHTLSGGGGPGAQARIYIATLLLFLTTLGLLYVVLFVSGDSQPSLWAVMLLRILAFLLPVYLIVQARACGTLRGPALQRPRQPLRGGHASVAALHVPLSAGVSSACASSACCFEAGPCDSGLHLCRAQACSALTCRLIGPEHMVCGVPRLCWRTCASGTPSMRGACRPRDATLYDVPSQLRFWQWLPSMALFSCPLPVACVGGLLQLGVVC
jgi:hypothetical protein